MNRLLVGFAALMAVMFVVAIILSLVERRREARRMRQAREANSLEFGAIGGPQFKRCKVCGAVRDA